MVILEELFHDIIPIPQDDGPHPVCSIAYPQGYVDAMGYLRAIMKNNERSERSLELTAICLRFNPANYTTWWFRRQCLAALSTPPEDHQTQLTYFSSHLIDSDLKLASNLGGSNPKNYQIWYHRRNLLECTFTGGAASDEERCLVGEELQYIASVLDEDAKNYHAWSHRQWALKTLNTEELWNKELDFTDKLIIKDVWNNSAWNDRWFASHRGLKSAPFCLEKSKNEVSYVIDKIANDPYNESPCRYLVAIVKEQLLLIGGEDKFRSFISECEKKIMKVKREFEESMKMDGNDCVQLIGAYIDILEMKGDQESYEDAKDLAEKLESRYDPIRRKYWKMRVNQFHRKLKL